VNVNRIHVVINPAAGQKAPVLHTLNAVFQDGVTWGVSVTHKTGDAEQQARAAAEAGADVVAAYGGDGTVLEVASGLYGTGVPLAILPGGTSNMLAVDLGIPRQLSAAAALILNRDAVVRALDMGDVHGKLFFHLGVGLEGEMIQKADRKAKETSGVLAYILSALQTLHDETPVRYRLTLDGQTVEAEGINCMITNYGRLGMAGLTLSHQIDMTDGLLDVIVVARADLRAFIAAAASAVVSRDFTQSLQQWQAHEVSVEADTPQTITRDGELLGRNAAIAAHVVPGAVRILMPK
jgi:diacylglycerol kinase (ATP)